MELFPEDRRRIYLEERARLEAQEELKEERKRKKFSRAKVLLLLFVALIFIGPIISKLNEPSAVPKTPEQLAAEKRQALADEKTIKQNYEGCKATLEKAKKLDMLYDIEAKGGSIKVFVGPTYFSVPIDAKEGFARTVNCVLMQGRGGGMYFDLLDWRSGKRVASWNAYKLKID